MAFNGQLHILLAICLSSLFLTSAHDSPSPAMPPAPLLAPVSFISSSPDASPSAALVSFISSAPEVSPSPSPSPLLAQQVDGETDQESLFVDGFSSALSMDIQKGITSVVEKTVIGIKAKTDQFINDVIAKRLNDPATDSYARECLKQCQENYGDASEDIGKVLSDISTSDFYKASVDLDAAATDVDTCSDCMKEMVGEDPEFKKFDQWMTGITGDCLGQLQKIINT